MGIETAKALTARRRESVAQIDRLIAQADEHGPIASARRTRIQETARLARRRIHALSAAQETVAAIELDIGRALLRLLGQGMSRNAAYELVGLRRHLGRRYLDLATSPAPPHPTGLSTDPLGDDATGRAGADPQHDGDPRNGPSPGRSL